MKPKRKLKPPVSYREVLAEVAALVSDVVLDRQAMQGFLDTPLGKPADKEIERLLEFSVDSLRKAKKLLAFHRDQYIAQQLKKLGLPESPSRLNLHIGSGKQILKGWINIDLCSPDLSLNVLRGLPFGDSSARYVFCSHSFEHLYFPVQATSFLTELHRVLEPGGVLRIIVPDAEKCFKAYVANDVRFFEERARTWAWSRNCRTRLEHILENLGAYPSPQSFQGHKYGYDFETLEMLLMQVGFSEIKKSGYQQSVDPSLRLDWASQVAGAQWDGNHYSLFVEAKRSA